MGFPLLPSQRIRKQQDFQRVFDKGKFAKGVFLAVWVCGSRDQGQGAAPRIGIIVSRKTDSRATRRNLWKRRIREAFRELQAKLKENTEVLIKSRTSSGVPSYSEIKQDLEMLFSQMGILK